ncbi:MAG: DUF3108 domain-containing protein [bacterium]
MKNWHFLMGKRYVKKMLLILLSVLCLPSFLVSQTKNLFSPGEMLRYEAKFGFIDLGSMVLEIIDTVRIEGRLCYAISSRLNSNPDLNFIFSLNDTINVFTTINEFLPVAYEKRTHEGKYKNYQKLQFDNDSFYVKINDSTKVTLTEPSRDLISFWYYLRMIKLIEGDTIKVAIFEGKQQHTIECAIREKEIVKTSLGKFSAIRVTPQTRGKGVFGPGGSMDIWYSDDNNRFPVQIKTKLKFGIVTFRLTGVNN